jgi:hypothetical protein
MKKLRKLLRRWQLRRQQPPWNRHPLFTDERGHHIYPAALADPVIYDEWRRREAERVLTDHGLD